MNAQIWRGKACLGLAHRWARVTLDGDRVAGAFYNAHTGATIEADGRAEIFRLDFRRYHGARRDAPAAVR